MVRYLVLFNFTEQGIKNIAQTLSRSGALVLEAADETTATALVAKLASAGNVRTQTLRAFDRGEMEGILGKVR
jgi:uncharacterized protein with GYD domain